MSPQLVGIAAAIAAEQARLEAMKTANAARESEGLALAYDEKEFFYVANALDNLSIQARNCQS